MCVYPTLTFLKGEMQSPNWLWLIWKYSPSIVHCQSFTERFALVPRYRTICFSQFTFRQFSDGGFWIFSFWPWEKWAETDDKLVYAERFRSCISLLKDVFFCKAQSWQWLRYWDEHSAVPVRAMAWQVWHHTEYNPNHCTDANRKSAMLLSGQYFDQQSSISRELEQISQWNIGSGQLKGSTFK